MLQKIMALDGTFVRDNRPPAPACNENALVALENEDLSDAISLTEKLLATGVFLLGAARTGKTTIIHGIVSQLQKKKLGPNDIMLILDTKGEFCKKFKRPQDVVIGGKKATKGWNLFNEFCSETDKEERKKTIQMIAAQIYPDKPTETNPYFTMASRRVFEILIDALAQHPDLLPEGQHLDNAGLLAFLERDDWGGLFHACGTHELEEYIGGSTKPNITQQTVRAEVFIGLRNSLCAGFDGHGGFSFTQAERHRSGEIIFLEYEPSGGSSEKVYALLINLLLLSFMRQNNRYATSGKLYLVLDELHLMGAAPETLVSTLNFGPGIGLGGVVVAAQSLTQLYSIAGVENANTLVAGLQSRMCFRVEDPASMKFVLDQAGEVLASVKTMIPGVSVSTQIQRLPAASEEEISLLPQGKALVKLPQSKPFFFYFRDYS